MRIHLCWSCCVILTILVVQQNGVSETTERKPRDVAQSANFVVTAPTEQLASAVLKQAEKLRKSIADEWLGEPLAAGIGKAVIITRLSDSENSGRTWPAEDPRRPTMVWLRASFEDVTGALLAHEIAHVVLSNRFPGQFPPWANEGIASQYDSEARKAIRLQILQSYVNTDQWPYILETLNGKKVFSEDQAGYAVASSLVDFLLTKGTRASLVEFAVEGRQIGWDDALQHHYRIAGLRDLQREWQGWVVRTVEWTERNQTSHKARNNTRLVVNHRRRSP